MPHRTREGGDPGHLGVPHGVDPGDYIADLHTVPVNPYESSMARSTTSLGGGRHADRTKARQRSSRTASRRGVCGFSAPCEPWIAHKSRDLGRTAKSQFALHTRGPRRKFRVGVPDAYRIQAIRRVRVSAAPHPRLVFQSLAQEVRCRRRRARSWPHRRIRAQSVRLSAFRVATSSWC